MDYVIRYQASGLSSVGHGNHQPTHECERGLSFECEGACRNV